MSGYQPKDNSGNLFKVPDLKSEKHPPYEGEFAVICPHCQAPAKGWVKAWVKDGKAGKFFSLAFKFKVNRPLGDVRNPAGGPDA